METVPHAVVRLAAGLTLAACASWAAAAPVTASFSGAVSLFNANGTSLPTDFPLGTPASFSITFDDAGLAPFAPPPTFNLAPVSGQMVLGSSTFEFSAGRIYSYMYSPLTQEVRWYGIEFTGSGPTTSNGGAFGSLAVSVEPDLDLWSDIGAIALQYLYTSPSGSLTQYAYAGLSGRWSAARGNAVPLPATPWLVIAGLAALTFRPRPRRNRAAASDEPLA